MILFDNLKEYEKLKSSMREPRSKWHRRRKKRQLGQFCRKGHEYTKENSGKDAAGHRYCKTCKRIYDQLKYQRQKQNSIK